MITNDVDVPVDWLYKGSKPHKKARRKNRSAVAVAGAAGKTERSRSLSISNASLSISNASLSHGMYADPHAKRVSGTMAIPGAMAGAIAGAGAVAIEDDDEVDIRADGGPGARMPALTKTHSLNQETKDEVPVLTPPPTPTQSRNSPSLVSVKRSASTSSKPKKTSVRVLVRKKQVVFAEQRHREETRHCKETGHINSLRKENLPTRAADTSFPGKCKLAITRYTALHIDYKARQGA